MSNSLSLYQAQQLVLYSQGLTSLNTAPTAIERTQKVIEQLGYVQIDAISVVERAHHHVLWNRNSTYQVDHLDRLIKEKHLFEYWSHAAAYLPMKEFRYSLFRKHLIKTGQQKHWFSRDENRMKKVYKRIESEGPLMAKDFESHGKKTHEWASKPTKQALENLYMQGDLMISHRHQFHKVYELTERVLPSHIKTERPTEQEHARFLILRYLKANGFGRLTEINYLLKGYKKPLIQVIDDMLQEGTLITLSIENNPYYALPQALDNIEQLPRHSGVHLLSPFDNVLIQRKRLSALFGFNYLLECYVPPSKRQYGYFCLPILWQGRFVARMDCKADRASATFHIQHLVLEGNIVDIEVFFYELTEEIQEFLLFNQCTKVIVHNVTPSIYQSQFQTFIEN